MPALPRLNIYTLIFKVTAEIRHFLLSTFFHGRAAAINAGNAAREGAAPKNSLSKVQAVKETPSKTPEGRWPRKMQIPFISRTPAFLCAGVSTPNEVTAKLSPPHLSLPHPSPGSAGSSLPNHPHPQGCLREKEPPSLPRPFAASIPAPPPPMAPTLQSSSRGVGEPFSARRRKDSPPVPPRRFPHRLCH